MGHDAQRHREAAAGQPSHCLVNFSRDSSCFQASAGGGLNVLSAEDRALNLDDTQGMFLLLGAGFLVGAASLFSEWVGGCFRFCKRSTRRDSIMSNPRLHDNPTPRDKIDSFQDNSHEIRNHFVQSERIGETTDCVVHSHEEELNDEQKKKGVGCDVEGMFDYDRLFGEKNEPLTQEAEQEILADEKQHKF